MTRRTRALIALAAATAAAATPTAVAPHAAVAQPAPSQARLEGTFQLTGRITVARHIRGEHVGQVVQRTWMFAPLCATGPCAQVRVVRARATGTDSLILTQTTPGHYAGSGQFFAPLECAGTVYAGGEEIPFKINVQITASTTAADGTTVASAISATYVNRSRLNLTRCVIVLGYDSARYSGPVVPA
jgi:hypothetical protein